MIHPPVVNTLFCLCCNRNPIISDPNSQYQ